MVLVAQARPSERAEFIKKTYLHVAGAVAAFIVVEFLLFQIGFAEMFGRFVAGSSFGWLAMLGGFALLGYLSSSFAAKAGDINAQYTGLGIYVLGEAVMFSAILWIASVRLGVDVITSAAVVTLALFAGLTAIVFTTGADFTFLGWRTQDLWHDCAGSDCLQPSLSRALVGHLVLVCNGGFCGRFNFCNQTSQVMRRYPTDYYVAASLALFSSVMLLFWYVLRIFMSRR